MNSRIEGGSPTFDNKQAIINEVWAWVHSEDVEMDDNSKAYFFNGVDEIKPEGSEEYISYWDTEAEYERKIFFPEADTLENFKKRMIFDDKVKEVLDPDAVTEFIYNCIDVNALSSVQHIAFLYDEPILDEDGEIEDWKETVGRQELMDKASDGCDEYAFEVGLEQLGINWVERSAVIINVSEHLKTAEQLSNDIYGNEYYADDIFREGLVQTICHEFRHAVYELNEVTPKNGVDERYPANGGLEENVEDYGNREAEKLMFNKEANKYISAMFQINGTEQKKVKPKENGRD